MTWTTGSLTCVRGHAYNMRYIYIYIYIHTRGLGTPRTSQHNIFYSEKISIFSCAPNGVRISGSLDTRFTDALPMEPPVTPSLPSYPLKWIDFSKLRSPRGGKHLNSIHSPWHSVQCFKLVVLYIIFLFLCPFVEGNICDAAWENPA